MPWFVRTNTGIEGPIASKDLRPLVQKRQITPATELSRSATGPWQKARDIPGLFSPKWTEPEPSRIPATTSGQSQPPPLSRSNASAIAPSTGQDTLSTLNALKAKGINALQNVEFEQRTQQAREAVALYKLFWSRILSSDFSVIRASPSEVDALQRSSAPVSSELAQDYASWRRSLLMVSLLMMGIGLLFNSLELIGTLSAKFMPGSFKAQSFFLFLAQVAATVLCGLAAFQWSELRRSRSLARFAWLTQFAGPVLIFLFPTGLFAKEPIFQLALGAIAGTTLLPKILGLFPGLIRSSLTLKTLLPETSVPGWLGIIVAPIYGTLLLSCAIVALQLSLYVLGFGFAMLACGVLVVVFCSESLLRPAVQAGASAAVRFVKLLQLGFQISGLCCIGFFALNTFPANADLFLRLIWFIISLIANVTLLTLVMSDFMLAMIYKGHVEAIAFAGTEMEQSLSERLADLSACGLTEIGAGELALASQLQEQGGALATSAARQGTRLMNQLRERSKNTPS